MASKAPLETQEQSNLIKWFRLQYRPIADCLFCIPNGSVLAGGVVARAKQMTRLKKEGLVVGVSDLFLMQPSCKYHGLFIEMKRKTGATVSEDQLKFIERAEKQGYKAVVCKGFEEAKDVIQDYLDVKG
ncbi:VRR-NUC domain-containing protein [Entomomonas moraniae]|uniref:VRR-NUC domain-containing protein n=1 Tax=Entomomonas moraniae TaxID=2213226 RepID=A0A3Q9JM64_9GAMM|nr:VRR-NUC domain-containing protein [Entomomonas moraniae]AZS50413.1 VRR-NUC domain-containing protein [Entomomonas moraniae]